MIQKECWYLSNWVTQAQLVYVDFTGTRWG